MPGCIQTDSVLNTEQFHAFLPIAIIQLRTDEQQIWYVIAII